MGETFFDLPIDIQDTLKYIAKHRAMSYGTQVPKELLDFLILDDLPTIVDPNSSAFEKALAGASITPWGKVVKIGGKVYRVASKGSDEAGYFAKGAGKGKGDFKNYSAKEIEKKYGLKKGEFHQVKQDVVNDLTGKNSSYKDLMKKTGKNPDIHLSSDGTIRVVSTQRGNNFSFDTTWNIQDFLP